VTAEEALVIAVPLVSVSPAVAAVMAVVAVMSAAMTAPVTAKGSGSKDSGSSNDDSQHVWFGLLAHQLGGRT
jgi:hypothetical protein